MPKTKEKQAPKKPTRPEVFGQGGSVARAGLYARVSTHDQQTLPLQLSAMRDYVSKRGWNVAVEVKDVGSGANLRQKREDLLKAARRRELDLVVVWRLDRWGRSLVDLVSTLQELAALKVGFVSLSEAPRSRWNARGLRGVRTRHSTRPRQSGDCTGSQGRKAAWSAADCSETYRPYASPRKERRQQAPNRKASEGEPDFSPAAPWLGVRGPPLEVSRQSQSSETPQLYLRFYEKSSHSTPLFGRVVVC